MLTCRACGATAPDEARFCPTCGNALAPAAPPAPEAGTAPPLPAEPGWGPVPPYQPGPPLPGMGTSGPGPRPLGVLLVSLWNMGVGALVVVVGLALATFAPFAFDDPATRAELEREIGGPLPAELFAGAIVFVGLFALLFGLGMVVVGWGLYNGKPWAWTGMVVLILVNALFNVLSLPVGLVGLLINAFLLWYFLQPGVKRYFGRDNPIEPGLPGYVPPPR